MAVLSAGDTPVPHSCPVEAGKLLKMSIDDSDLLSIVCGL